MALPRSIGAYFRLDEFPHFQKATEAEADILEQQLRAVEIPARRAFGAILPTSWLYWSDGRPRTGAHSDPGTRDWVAAGRISDLGGNPYLEAKSLSPAEESIWKKAHGELAEWIAINVPWNLYGQVIDEGHHIHMTRPGVGGEAGRNPVGEWWRKREDGTFILLREKGRPAFRVVGTEQNPFELPPLTVSLGVPAWIGWALAALLTGLALTENRKTT